MPGQDIFSMLSGVTSGGNSSAYTPISGQDAYTANSGTKPPKMANSQYKPLNLANQGPVGPSYGSPLPTQGAIPDAGATGPHNRFAQGMWQGQPSQGPGQGLEAMLQQFGDYLPGIMAAMGGQGAGQGNGSPGSGINRNMQPAEAFGKMLEMFFTGGQGFPQTGNLGNAPSQGSHTMSPIGRRNRNPAARVVFDQATGQTKVV